MTKTKLHEDPEPWIIQLLRNARWTLGDDEAREDLLEIFESIVKAWDETESYDDMRLMLGLNAPSRRRRTADQVKREFAIAMEFAAQIHNGRLSAKQHCNKLFGCDERTAEKFYDKWKHIADRANRVSPIDIGK